MLVVLWLWRIVGTGGEVPVLCRAFAVAVIMSTGGELEHDNDEP